MLNLTQNQITLFNLLRLAIGKELLPQSKKLADIDWLDVLQEAQMQAVPLLAAEGLGMWNNSSAPSEEVQTKWDIQSGSALRTNFSSLFSAQEMTRVMRAGPFEYIIIKGIAAAAYYPEAELRILGDVDFLINPVQQSIIEKTLLNEGYKRSAEDNPHHVGFYKPDQELEMHFTIPGIPNGKKGKLVRQYISDVLKRPVQYSLAGENFCLPQPKHNGLILLLHMQHHMLGEGLGLRHLMDWACFVDKTNGDSFWEEDLLPLLKSIGMLRYAQVMAKAGALYFGTVCPEWAKEAEEDLCDAVMQDVLSGGNFGCKDQVRAASGNMISSSRNEGTGHGKIYNLWKTMIISLRCHYPWLKKVPILYPFLFLWRTILYGWRMMTGEKVSLAESIKVADERKSVYERLAIFETSAQSREK